MSIHLSGSSDPSGSSSPALSAGHDDSPTVIRNRSALGSGRPCPFLGSQDGPGLANSSPSRMNVCHAHPRKEWQGMRRVTVPYSRLTREKQAAVCFAAFNQCPYHQQAAPQAEELKHQLQEQAHPAGADAPPHASHRGRKRRPARRSSAPMSNRKRTILQFAGLGAGAAACAFVVTLVISAEPSRMFDFIFDYIMLQDIKSFGLADKGLDKSATGGIATGGNLRSLKNMSGADREKLKSKLGNMSEAEKQKLKEKYKAMMGK